MTLTQPLRILVVENDPQQRADLIETLRAWPCEYFAAEPFFSAEDPSAGLLEDAKSKARRYRCHLALVDLRLKDDNDLHDTSGLALVAELAPTLSIILSGYLDRQIVKTAPDLDGPPQRPCDFVGKEDGPDALWRAIQQAARNRWCRREVEFLRPQELEPSMLIRRFVSRGETAPPDQVDDVLRRLFPKATRLKVEPLTENQSSASLLLRQRSWVFKVFENEYLRPVIVKLARSGRISNELQRFSDVKPFFPAARYAILHGQPVELWDVGGTVYEFIGDHHDFPVATFSEYCQMHESQEIGEALANFRSFWRRLYQRQPVQSRQTILRACNSVWGDEWCRRLLDSQQTSYWQECAQRLGQGELPNPIAWLIRKVSLTAPGQYNDGGLPYVDIAMIHGDLHSGNLFVDTRGDIWVIDYERTGYGPIVLDWTELEVDILTQSPELDLTEPASLHLLQVLLASPTVSIPEATPVEDATLGKLWAVLYWLRRQADSTLPTSDARPYLWGVLFNALFRLTLLFADLDGWERGSERQVLLRIALLAGLLCHRLDHVNGGWSLVGRQGPTKPKNAIG